MRDKIYFNDENKVLRFTPNYMSEMPKNGNGNFLVIDRGIELGGTLKDGKIDKITRFSKIEPNAKVYRTFLSSDDKNDISYFVKKFLEQAEEGSLKLQNLTKVVMKKVLVFLAK